MPLVIRGLREIQDQQAIQVLLEILDLWGQLVLKDQQVLVEERGLLVRQGLPGLLAQQDQQVQHRLYLGLQGRLVRRGLRERPQPLRVHKARRDPQGLRELLVQQGRQGQREEQVPRVQRGRLEVRVVQARKGRQDPLVQQGRRLR